MLNEIIDRIKSSLLSSEKLNIRSVAIGGYEKIPLSATPSAVLSVEKIGEFARTGVPTRVTVNMAIKLFFSPATEISELDSAAYSLGKTLISMDFGEAIVRKPVNIRRGDRPPQISATMTLEFWEEQ